jgi:predicted RND superfamily exporter protein/ABC-type transporter Mla subunit MlaD
MKNISKNIVKYKWWILVISILLIIPAIIGMEKTKINYDILVYLPSDIETMKGEDILTNDFDMGAFSLSVVENMSQKDVLELEDKIKEIDGVEKVVTIDDLTGTTIPVSMLPTEFKDKVAKDGSTLMLITFKESTSNQETLDAVQSIRDLTGESVKVGGMSAMVLDTMNLSNSEIAIYIVIAVVLCIIVLMICMDSYLVPFILLLNIGIAILYNMGTNIFLGNISYITKAISAVLQLGVTTDFSIFLYHRFEAEKKVTKSKEEAMVIAIDDTFKSILGSSLTTIAGFLALCTMTLLLGKDIGIVMAKGVLFGVICVLTIFPALILIFDKQIDKTVHREILPKFTHVKNFVTKHYKLILVIFILLCIPAYIGNKNVKVYYNLSKSLPTTLQFSVANQELKDKYNIVSPEVILVDKTMKNNDINEMIDKIEDVDGITFALSYSEFSNLGLPDDLIPEDVYNTFNDGEYQMIIVNSKYEIATDELNNQIGEINDIVKTYDDKAIVAGEGPLMKDMVNISNTDFNNVNYTSIAVIFIIMVFVLGSISLPVILVTAIEFAIFVNMSSFYYTGVTLPFIASIVIGTIQLGATIDYAILMTTKYLDKRKAGEDSVKSMHYALDNSVQSVFTSGLCFFAATFGVGLYSKIDIIGAICHLISRGALISMAVVILILPSLLMVCDPIIIRTTKGFKKGKKNMKNNISKKINKKAVAACLAVTMLIPFGVNAQTKDETVYSRLNNEGNTIETIVSDELSNVNGDVVDESNLNNIKNVNGDEEFLQNGTNLIWKSEGNNIYYQGSTSKALPINIDIKYYLDGELINVNDLNGKSGHIKMVLNYTNTDKHGNLYTPFVVTMTTTLSNSANTNITIDTGKVVSNGTSSIIVGLATPGLSESLNIDELDKFNSITIEYDTTDFTEHDIYNAYAAKVIDEDDLKIFDKMDDLYSSVDTLTNASTQLVSGSNALSTGMNTYTTNFKTYKNGMNALTEGISKINTNYSKLNAGINKLNSNLSELSSIASDLSQLKSGLEESSTGLTKINAGLDQIKKTLDIVNAGGYNLGQSSTIGLVADVKGLETYMSALAQSQGKTCDIQNKDITGCDQNLFGIYQDLSAESSIINGLSTKITELEAGITKIQTGINTMDSSIDVASLTTKLTALSNGVNELVSASNQMNGALQTLNSSSELLNNATNELYDATNELNNGAQELSEGMSKFDSEGIQKINSYVNGDIASLQDNLEDLKTLSDNYGMFTAKTNETSGNTKFIVKIEANN